jgi:hypothetical protein
MLEKGRGVNAQALSSVTPSALHIAAANGQVGLVEALIAAGANVNAQCEFKFDAEVSGYYTKVRPLAVAIAVSVCACFPPEQPPISHV